MNRAGMVAVVDDDAATRSALVMLLRARGLDCVVYKSAEAYLAEYEPDQVGCVVVDLRMDGMHGLDLIDRLADDDSAPPVIVLTGFADVSSTVRAMRAGALTLIEKPWSADELWASLERALEVDARRRKERGQRHDIEARLATLSTQEHAVLELLLEGQLNKVIARRLGVSLRTVERERAAIFRKMQATSLVQLIEQVVSLRR